MTNRLVGGKPTAQPSGLRKTWNTAKVTTGLLVAGIMSAAGCTCSSRPAMAPSTEPDGGLMVNVIKDYGADGGIEKDAGTKKPGLDAEAEFHCKQPGGVIYLIAASKSDLPVETEDIVDPSSGRSYRVNSTVGMSSEGTVTYIWGIWDLLDSTLEQGLDREAANHGVIVPFLGRDFVVSFIGESMLQRQVVLIQESARGILRVGETLLLVGCYAVRLDDVFEDGSVLISIRDFDGRVVHEGVHSSQSLIPIEVDDGEILRIRIWQTAPGYTFESKWADISVVEKLLVLTSNLEPVIHVYRGENVWKGWEVGVLWDNEGGLRAIFLSAPEGTVGYL